MLIVLMCRVNYFFIWNFFLLLFSLLWWCSYQFWETNSRPSCWRSPQGAFGARTLSLSYFPCFQRFYLAFLFSLHMYWCYLILSWSCKVFSFSLVAMPIQCLQEFFFLPKQFSCEMNGWGYCRDPNILPYHLSTPYLSHEIERGPSPLQTPMGSPTPCRLPWSVFTHTRNLTLLNLRATIFKFFFEDPLF